MQTVSDLPGRTPPPTIKAPFGWQVRPVAVAAALAATAFAVVAGALLVLSLWFMAFGFPVLMAAVPTAVALLKRRRPGAPKPAIFVYVLGLVELSGVGVLMVLGGSVTEDWNILGPTAIPGVVTLLIGWFVQVSTTEASAPPPSH